MCVQKEIKLLKEHANEMSLCERCSWDNILYKKNVFHSVG